MYWSRRITDDNYIAMYAKQIENARQRVLSIQQNLSNDSLFQSTLPLTKPTLLNRWWFNLQLNRT